MIWKEEVPMQGGMRFIPLKDNQAVKKSPERGAFLENQNVISKLLLRLPGSTGVFCTSLT
jgi:hypothetical protein